jgi:hypothetical protein
MAAKRSARYPYQWHDGTWHSTPQAPPRVNPVKPIVRPRPAKPAVGPRPSLGARTLPPDAQYEADIATAQRQLPVTQAGLVQQRTGTLADYGYSEAGWNPATGMGTGLAFNPHDPFSKAALLKKTYDASRASTGQTMGAGGQLYSGAYQQAQDIGNREQLGAEDALQKSLVSWLAENTGAYTQAGLDEQTAEMQAAGGRMDRLADNPLYSPEATGTLRPAAKKAVAPRPRSVPKLVARPGGRGVTTTTRRNKRGQKVTTYTRAVRTP